MSPYDANGASYDGKPYPKVYNPTYNTKPVFAAECGESNCWNTPGYSIAYYVEEYVGRLKEMGAPLTTTGRLLTVEEIEAASENYHSPEEQAYYAAEAAYQAAQAATQEAEAAYNTAEGNYYSAEYDLDDAETEEEYDAAYAVYQEAYAAYQQAYAAYEAAQAAEQEAESAYENAEYAYYDAPSLKIVFDGRTDYWIGSAFGDGVYGISTDDSSDPTTKFSSTTGIYGVRPVIEIPTSALQ